MTEEIKKEDAPLPTRDEILQAAEGEVTQEPSGSEAPVRSERETQAMSFGWKPKDEWVEGGGDPEDWRPARDFLERGEMIGKIRSLTKEAAETQRALRHTMEQNNKIYQTGYTNAINDLKQERKAALQDGDLVLADEISEKIDAVKEKLQETKVSVPQLPAQQDPEHVEWLQRNAWYEKDVVLQEFADAVAKKYVRDKQGRVEPNDVRKFVETTVKKEFAHRFEAGKPVRAAQSPDGNGSRATGSKSDSGDTSRLSKIEADMPEHHKVIMRTMLKADPKFTKAEYLKMYVGGR